jgi:hypothetical protein
MQKCGRRIPQSVLTILLLACCFWFFSPPSLVDSAETEISSGVQGIWKEPGQAFPDLLPWQAQWIWTPENIVSDMMLARRSFDLSDQPKSALLRIAATSQYQLFVNGTFTCRGPARSAPHHQSFDLLDIAPLLRKGRNTLAVRVHYLRGVVSYHHPGRAGLLAQLELVSGSNATTLATDSRWKVHPDPVWGNDAPRISRFHLKVSDRVDLRLQLRNWSGRGFDDASWPFANPLQRNTGWPAPQENARPHALTPPWTSLLPRDIPYLVETEKKALNLIEAAPIAWNETNSAELSNADTVPAILDGVTLSNEIDERVVRQVHGYKKGNGPLVIPRVERRQSAFLLFDFGGVLNGRPRLDIEGPAGTIVDVMCAPYTLDNRFTSKIVDSELTDRVVLSGQRDAWEAACLKPVRFMGLSIYAVDGPVRVYNAAVSQVEYPFAEKGSLRTPENPWFEKCWQASAETIRVCTTDAYTDNYRERRQYAQTGYYAALGNYAVFGDTALQRRYLMQIAEEQQANGMMPAYAPRTGDDFMVILDSNCFWVRSLHDYLLYSGDEETVRALIPPAFKLMELFQRYTDSHGLLDSPPYAYWLDHARNDRRGANFTLNGHYLGALESFSQILDWLDDPGSQVFEERADRLRQTLRTRLWDPQRRLFADAWVEGERSEMFSEHANALALAMKVATPEQATAIADELLAEDEQNFIQRESGITMVTPAMSYYLHTGLCRYGYVEESLNLLQSRFSHMLQGGSNGTLWEEWWLDATGRSGVLTKGRTRSDAQTESAFPPALFAEFILGIRPTRPGLEEVIVFHPKSGLTKAEGEIPSPLGNLLVRWALEKEGGGNLNIEVPEGMRVNLDLASLGLLKERGVSVNGRRLDRAQETAPYLELRNGKHAVEF